MSLSSLKVVASSVPTVLPLDSDDTKTNPYDIGNTFNNYCSWNYETKHKIFTYTFYTFTFTYSHIHLVNQNGSAIFLQPTDIEKIARIISSLNSNKTSDLNRIEYNNIIYSKKWHCEAIVRFIQPLFHEWCFFICTQNCKSNSCF